MIKNNTTTLGSLFTLLIVALVISSCGTVKKAKWSTEHISVKEAYAQKYVSGQEDGVDITYLFVDIDILDTAIVLDSATYQNYTVPVSTVRMPLKINFKKGRKCDCEDLHSEKAILFYTKGKKHFKSIVEGITVKEDLYLP